MKTLIYFLLLPFFTAGALVAEEKPEAKVPTAEVYQIRMAELRTSKALAKPSAIPLYGVIMEISNPAEETFSVRGVRIESPAYDIEVKRGEKWVAKPVYDRDEWIESFSLKPGAKMLVTVTPPMGEPVSRFRFYFFTTNEKGIRRVVTVRSREIQGKELHGLEQVDNKAPEKMEGYKEVRSDEEINKELEELAERLKIRSGGSMKEPQWIEIK